MIGDLTLARRFKNAVINIVSKEGQPATLGTAGGAVYYNDGTNDHLDRVWVRMGSDEQVLVIAKAIKKGMPNIPGLEVNVVKRHGTLYVDDWESGTAPVELVGHKHDFDTRNVVVGETSEPGGADNVVMGYEAGDSLESTADKNVLIGAYAGLYVNDDDGNVYVGYKAGGGDAMIGGAAPCMEKGTKSSAFSTGPWEGEFAEWAMGNPIIEIDTDKYVMIYEDVSESNTYVQAFSMSGDAITFGIAVDVDVESTLGGGHLCYVDTNKFAVIYNDDGGIGQAGVPAIKIGTVATLAITLGSIQNVLNTYENTSLDGIYEVGIGLSAVCPDADTIVVTRFGKIMESYIPTGSCVESSDFGVWSMWGDISGTDITWEEWDDCGSVALKTVGKWRDHVRGLVSVDWGHSTSIKLGSVGLVAVNYDSTPTQLLKVFGVDATENNASALVPVDNDVLAANPYTCLFELTSTKAIIVWITTVGSNETMYGAVISMTGPTPTVGPANILLSDASLWARYIYGASITSTQAVLSYVLVNNGDCRSNMILNISGNTITVDDVCNSMNKYSAGVMGHTATRYMLMGYETDSPNDGYIWSGITASDVGDCIAADISSNTFIGANAGEDNLGAGGVCLGANAGDSEINGERLHINNSTSGGGTAPLIYGEFDDGNIGFNTTDMGAGTGVIGILNATLVPGSNPTGGGVLYVEGGALKYRGGSGSVTTIAPA